MKTKKIIILNLILLLLIGFCFVPKTSIVASSNNATYARVKANNTHLYKTAHVNETIENKWCLLPETFFVKILDNFNDIFYKVQYKDIVGYVKKEHVNLVNETPINPYPTQTMFSLKPTLGAHLRFVPKQNSSLNNTILTIPQGTHNIVYLGKIFGDEGVDTQGKIWYLVNFNNHTGYIHSYFANSYIYEPVNNEYTTLKLSVEDSNLNPLTSYENGFLIILAIIPLIGVLILLYKPSKSKKLKSLPPSQTKAAQKTTVEINDFTEPEL